MVKILMDYMLEILIVGLVLSADSFSAALAMGFRNHTKWDVVKFALSSGIAEGLVAFFGAMIGVKVIAEFDKYDHWISFVLLLIVSLHMIKEGWEEIRAEKNEEQSAKVISFHSFAKVLMVSFATSLDAFAVGVTLGSRAQSIGVSLYPYIISISLWAFFSTIFGMALAKRVSERFGGYFSLAGALVLLVMAFKLLK